MFVLTFKGLPNAERELTHWMRGCASIGSLRMKLMTDRPYAYGIETGRTRTGRVARRAGGAWMFRDSWRTIQPQVLRAYQEAVPHGDGAVNGVTHQFGARWLGLARSLTPVRTGALRRSEQVVYR